MYETADCGRKGKSEIDKVSWKGRRRDTQGCAQSLPDWRQVYHR